MPNYIKNLRRKIGHDKFIHPGARILVENTAGEFLFIERRDNGDLALPAGGLEENETIEACIRREVYEETGLTLGTVQVIGIMSAPATQTVIYPNGDQIQYFIVEFYSNDFTGELQVHDHQEITSARFLTAENLQRIPLNEQAILESWQHYQTTNKVRLG